LLIEYHHYHHQGELYQLILDGIIEQTFKNIPNSQRCDKILNYDVIKGAGKMLGMDENSLLNILKLRVNSSTIHIDDFTLQSGSVCLSGSAFYYLCGYFSLLMPYWL
jgi:hypothetical protein